MPLASNSHIYAKGWNLLRQNARWRGVIYRHYCCTRPQSIQPTAQLRRAHTDLVRARTFFCLEAPSFRHVFPFESYILGPSDYEVPLVHLGIVPLVMAAYRGGSNRPIRDQNPG